MEPIEVTVRYDLHGKTYPQQFVWDGQVFPVTSTGRRWQDVAGLHVLVMTADMKTYELVFDTLELRWYLDHASLRSKIALST